MPRGRKKKLTEQTVDTTRRIATTKALIGFGIVILLAGMAAALLFRKDQPTPEIVRPEVLGQSMNQPDNQSLIISGAVYAVFDDQIFSIGGKDYSNGKETLVIMTKEISRVHGRTAGTVLPYDIVTLQGHVQTYDQVIREKKLSSVMAEVTKEFTKETVFLADQIQIIPRIYTKSPQDMQTITDTTRLTNRYQSLHYIGTPVEVQNISVQDRVSDRFYWAGTDTHNRILIQIPENNMLEVGQQIAVSGVVKALPSFQELSARWGLTDKDFSVLRHELIYLEVNTIESVVQTFF